MNRYIYDVLISKSYSIDIYAPTEAEARAHLDKMQTTEIYELSSLENVEIDLLTLVYTEEDVERE